MTGTTRPQGQERRLEAVARKVVQRSVDPELQTLQQRRRAQAGAVLMLLAFDLGGVWGQHLLAEPRREVLRQRPQPGGETHRSAG